MALGGANGIVAVPADDALAVGEDVAGDCRQRGDRRRPPRDRMTSLDASWCAGLGFAPPATGNMSATIHMGARLRCCRTSWTEERHATASGSSRWRRPGARPGARRVLRPVGNIGDRAARTKDAPQIAPSSFGPRPFADHLVGEAAGAIARPAGRYLSERWPAAATDDVVEHEARQRIAPLNSR